MLPVLYSRLLHTNIPQSSLKVSWPLLGMATFTNSLCSCPGNSGCLDPSSDHSGLLLPQLRKVTELFLPLRSSSNFELCTFSHAEELASPSTTRVSSHLVPAQDSQVRSAAGGLPSSRPIAWPFGPQLLILTQQTHQAESYPAPWQQEPRARAPVDLHSRAPLRRCAWCRRRPGAGRAPPPCAGVGDTGSPPLLPVRRGWGMLAYPLPVESWRGQPLSLAVV